MAVRALFFRVLVLCSLILLSLSVGAATTILEFDGEGDSMFYPAGGNNANLVKVEITGISKGAVDIVSWLINFFTGDAKIRGKVLLKNENSEYEALDCNPGGLGVDFSTYGNEFRCVFDSQAHADFYGLPVRGNVQNRLPFEPSSTEVVYVTGRLLPSDQGFRVSLDVSDELLEAGKALNPNASPGKVLKILLVGLVTPLESVIPEIISEGFVLDDLRKAEITFYPAGSDASQSLHVSVSGTGLTISGVEAGRDYVLEATLTKNGKSGVLRLPLKPGAGDLTAE